LQHFNSKPYVPMPHCKSCCPFETVQVFTLFDDAFQLRVLLYCARIAEAALRGKGDTIVAAKLDRMFRSASDAINMVEIFREKGIKLVLFDLGSEPVAESALGQCFFTITAAIAQMERTIIRERMTSGKKAKKANGGHIGGKTPYGYRKVGIGRQARLEAKEDEQKVIGAIRELFIDRPCVPVSLAAQRLGELGLNKARNGKPFFPQQLSRIIEQARRVNH
jgi:DNA invertase Pin-like site-specific DNA recombinase